MLFHFEWRYTLKKISVSPLLSVNEPLTNDSNTTIIVDLMDIIPID